MQPMHKTCMISLCNNCGICAQSTKPVGCVCMQPMQKTCGVMHACTLRELNIPGSLFVLRCAYAKKKALNITKLNPKISGMVEINIFAGFAMIVNCLRAVIIHKKLNCNRWLLPVYHSNYLFTAVLMPDINRCMHLLYNK